MGNTIVIRTIVPIFLLIGLGFLSRKLNILRQGDERVLNAYVYYFALPALFLVNLAETTFTLANLAFIAAGIAPVAVAVMTHWLLWKLFGFSRETFYLLVLTTIFGSLAFFGIPFVTFAFPGREAEYFATLAVASISVVSVSIAITVLEFYRLGPMPLSTGMRLVAVRLSRNPLILSIAAGTALSLFRIPVPDPAARLLHMLGSTTSTVAIFLLGVFLYGRTYTHLLRALKLSLLRIMVMPVLALGSVALFGLHGKERAILVLMHSMPLAISMIVLSERYDFHKETIASLIMISSLGAGIYLNIWLKVLGH